MALSLKPATTIEEEVYRRVISNIPAGDFYIRATHVQPRRDGDTKVRLLAEVDTVSEVSGTQRRVLAVYVNQSFKQFVAIDSRKVVFAIRMEPAPTVNFIRVVDGTLDTATASFVPGGTEASTSVVVTTFASVFFGASLYYYRKLWLPYIYQFWSLMSEWGTRLIEWQLKYHNNFPNTAALHALSARLTSRAVWHEAPTERGIRDLVGSLCASTPVRTELSNVRPTYDLALYPFRADASSYSGVALDCWLPDIPSAKEAAFLRLASNVDHIKLKDHGYGATVAQIDSDVIELRKSPTLLGLAGIMQIVGPHDYWKAFIEAVTSTPIYFRFWGNPLDNVVLPPGLGAGTTFDTGFFDQATLDTFLPFQHKWTGQQVTVTDDPRVTLDSVQQLGWDKGEPSFSGPAASLWTTTLLSGSMTAPTVTNTLHGGAAPDFSV